MKTSKYSDLKNNKEKKRLYTFGTVNDNCENYYYDKFPNGYTPLFFYRNLEELKYAQQLLNEIEINFNNVIVIEDTYDWQSSLQLA